MFTNTGRTHGEGLGRSHVLYRCLWGIDFSTFKDGNNGGHLQPLQGSRQLASSGQNQSAPGPGLHSVLKSGTLDL